jgi:hypothetical protein
MSDDWQLLQMARAHILLIGPVDALEESLEAVLQHATPPVVEWVPDMPHPSPDGAKTLVIRNVERLSPAQQDALSTTLIGLAPHVCQVITTSAVPLYALVASGAFLDTLYYRLNMLLLDITPRAAQQRRPRTQGGAFA